MYQSSTRPFAQSKQSYFETQFQSPGHNFAYTGGAGAPFEEVLRDVHTKYENHVSSNLRTGAAISELEMILEAERRKTKELKDRLEADLENERRLRVDFENKLIKLKDESMKKEMLISELDFKVNNLAHENQSLLTENNQIKDENIRMTEIYNMKIREYEEKLNYQHRQLSTMEMEYREELENIKRQHQQEMQRIIKEWESRYSSIEQKCHSFMGTREEMEREIRRLNDVMMKMKLQGEEEIKEMAIRIQEEEYRKYLGNLKNLESKLHACEEARETLLKKNQELMRMAQEKDRQYQEEQMFFETQASKFKQEISDLRNQVGQAELLVGKMRSEIANKENVLTRAEAEFFEMQKSLQKQKEISKTEMENAIREINNEKRYLEDIKDQQARKIAELESIVKQQEIEIGRIKADYDRLCNMLQNNINKTIFKTMSEATVSPAKPGVSQSQIGFNRGETFAATTGTSGAFAGGAVGGGTFLRSSGYQQSQNSFSSKFVSKYD